MVGKFRKDDCELNKGYCQNCKWKRDRLVNIMENTFSSKDPFENYINVLLYE